MSNKILVVSPPSRFFPHGMSYVLSCLERHGIDFDFTDAQFGNEYTKLLKKNDYCAVATGGLLFQFRFYDEVFRAAREINPDIPAILGGNITRDMQPGFLFEKLRITYGVVGEAETCFPFLVDALLHNKTGLYAIPGLLFKDPQTGQIRKNPADRLDLAAADILPAWHRFDVDYYISEWEHGVYRHRLSMPVLASRGCTGTCTFCSPTIGGYSKRPPEQVVREIVLLSERYTFDWIGFNSEMFYPTRGEVAEFCEAYKSVKHRKRWTCELRVDADIDIDTFRLMKSVDCVAVIGGVESGSDKILSLMNKRTTREMIIRFYRNAEAAGVPCEGTIQMGNEGETVAEIRETIDMVTSGKMRVNERLPITYPGTKIYENAVKRGLINNENDYLQRLSFSAELWDYRWLAKDYLNISNIPDDKFLETIVSESRRFNTFNLKHYAPRNITCSTVFGMLIKVSGECIECGSTVTYVTPRRMLGIQTFCRDCFRTAEFNLYEMQEFNDHHRHLCAKLQKTTRLAIIGTATEATNFLKYDYFTFNYNSLVAFVETDRTISGISTFYHLPRIRIEGLPDVAPDTILIADDQFGNAELKIRNFYLKENLQPPLILHLVPDDKRPHAWLLRFVRRHSAVTLWNKYLVVPVIGIPIMIAEVQTQALSLIKSNYALLMRNAFIRMLLKKMQFQR